MMENSASNISSGSASGSASPSSKPKVDLWGQIGHAAFHLKNNHSCSGPIDIKAKLAGALKKNYKEAVERASFSKSILGDISKKIEDKRIAALPKQGAKLISFKERKVEEKI